MCGNYMKKLDGIFMICTNATSRTYNEEIQKDKETVSERNQYILVNKNVSKIWWSSVTGSKSRWAS